jgi:hypothetical protein
MSRLLERFAQPPPGADDVRAVEAALARVTPTQAELTALFDALASRQSDGHFVNAAFRELRRIRAKIHAARADVLAVRHSALRDDVLSYLAGVDGIFATLDELGRNTDAVRAARLRARAATFQKQVETSSRSVARHARAGKP